MGSNREDGGCRTGVAFWASFLRNNDPRRVDALVGFNAQRAIHHWDMKGRRRRAPLGRLFCATGVLASRTLQSLAAGVALCRRGCSISGARFLDCFPFPFFFFPPPLSSPTPITHSPFSLFARGFLPGSLLAFAFRGAWRAASKKFRLGLRVGCWPAQLGAVCAGHGGKRAGPSALFCLKWVGGGAGPAKTAGLMNGRSPFFFLPCETPAPRQRPSKPPGRKAHRGLFR